MDVLSVLGFGIGAAQLLLAVDQAILGRKVTKNQSYRDFVAAKDKFASLNARLPAEAPDWADQKAFFFSSEAHQFAQEARALLILCFGDANLKPSSLRMRSWEMLLHCTTVLYFDGHKEILLKEWLNCLNILISEVKLGKKCREFSEKSVKEFDQKATIWPKALLEKKKQKFEALKSVSERLTKLVRLICELNSRGMFKNSSANCLSDLWAVIHQLLPDSGFYRNAQMSLFIALGGPVIATTTTGTLAVQPSADSNLPEQLSKFLLYLRYTYIKSCEIMQREWSDFLEFKDSKKFKLDDFYIDLDIATDSISDDCVKNYDEIFDSMDTVLDDRTTRIILEGEAGTGKTTFVHKLVKDWASFDKTPTENASWLKERFSVIILVRLGELKISTTFGNSLTHLAPKSYITDDLVALLEDIEIQQKTLIILDAFDEFLNRKLCSDFDEIFAGKMFHFATVLITSRPTQVPELRTIMPHHKLLRTKGLQEEQMLTLARDHENLTALLETRDEPLIELLQNPLLFFMASAALPAKRKLHNLELFDIMEAFVKRVVERFAAKPEHFQVAQDDLRLIWFELGCREAARVLPEEAVSQLDNLQLDSQHSLLPLASRMGYVWANRGLDSDNDWVFPHRLFAEYFLAYFLTDSTNRQQLSNQPLFDNLSEEVKYFSSGFDRNFSDIILEFTFHTGVGAASKQSAVLPWFYRAEEIEICQEISEDIFDQGFLQVCGLSFEFRPTDSVMLSKISAKLPPDEELQSVQLSFVYLDRNAKPFFEMLGRSGCEDLILTECRCTSSVKSSFQAALASKTCQENLQSIEMKAGQITASDMAEILSPTPSMESLYTLHLEKLDANSFILQAFANCDSTNFSNLTHLQLVNCRLDEISCKILLAALDKLGIGLQTLDLSLTPLTADCQRSLPALVLRMKTKELLLSHCGLSEEFVEPFSSLTRDNNEMLKQLSVGGNEMVLINEQFWYAVSKMKLTRIFVGPTPIPEQLLATASNNDVKIVNACNCDCKCKSNPGP